MIIRFHKSLLSAPVNGCIIVQMTENVLTNYRITEIGKMKQHYSLYVHDIPEVCPLILRLYSNFLRQTAIFI